MRVSVLAAIALFLVSRSAVAQTQYVPMIMDEPTYNAVMTALGDVPAKYALPFITTLQQLEKQSQDRKTAQEVQSKKKDGETK